MKVLFVTRPSLLDHPGGDTLHVRQTRTALQALAVEVVLASDLAPGQPHDFDLVHFFNLHRPYDLWPYRPFFRAKPLVVSSIFVQYPWPLPGDGKMRQQLYGWLGSAGTEYLKSLARALRGQEPAPPFFYWREGQAASIRWVLERSAALITATGAEAESIAHWGPLPERQLIQPPGADHVPEGPAPQPGRTGIVQAARVEPLKNQLNLVQAAQAAGLPLQILGAVSRNHQNYARAIEAAGGGAALKGSHSREGVLNAMDQARVHALPSFYETTGLSTLEALRRGCQIVVNDHPIQRELWGERAFYAYPAKAESIKSALEQAYQAQDDHRAWVTEGFSWARMGQKIAELYRQLI